MLIIRILIIFTFSILAMGCANRYPSVELYTKKMNEKKEQQVSLWDAQLVNKSQKLGFGEKIKFELNESSMILKDKDGSYFKSFAVQGKKGTKYKIEIQSFVSRGKEHYVAVPELRLVTTKHKVINLKPTSLSGTLPAVGPYRMIGEWEGEFRDSKPHYFVVTSDNRFLNKQVDKESATLFAPGVFSILTWKIFGHFMGEMDIVVTE